MKPLRTSVVVLLTVALLMPVSAAAQSESPEARDLASLTLSSATYDLIFSNATQMGALTAKVGVEGRLGRQLTEDETRRLGEFFAGLWKRVGPTRAQIEALYVDFLARYYSVKEMKDLLAFYRTPLGVKTLRFPTASNEELRPAIERLITSSQPDFVRLFTAEFPQEFPELIQEFDRKQRR